MERMGRTRERERGGMEDRKEKVKGKEGKIENRERKWEKGRKK